MIQIELFSLRAPYQTTHYGLQKQKFPSNLWQLQYIYIYYSPGLGPERVRPPTFGKGQQAKTSTIISACCFGFRQKINNFPELESEMTHSGKGLRNELRNEQLLLFLAQIVVSCSKNAHARGAVREPRGLPLVTHLRWQGTLFPERFLDPFFSLKITTLYENGSQNGANMKSFDSYFPARVRKQKSVFGLRRRVRIAYEHLPWNAPGDSKIEDKKCHISEPCFLAK